MVSMEGRQQQNFPAIPPSLSAGNHEMRDYYADSSAPRPPTNSSPYLTPYLGLRSRLSQIWLNRWTVLLLLVLVRVLFAISSADDLIDDARTEALSACTVVEKAGSTLASIPHYASQGFNAMTARGVESAVDALQSMVTMTLTGVEEMVVFYIGMLTNTYLCLITLAVSGSLHAVVDVVSKAESSIKSSFTSVGNDIDNTVATLKKGVSILPGINTLFDGAGALKWNFSEWTNKLRDFKMPDGLDSDLQKLNNSIPTFDQVHNLTETAIRLPFERVKSLVNSSWSNYTFNHSLLPVPQKEEMQLCSDNQHISNFFGSLRDIARKARHTFIGVLLTLAILVCAPMAILEIRRYQRLQARSNLVHEYALDKMDTAYLYARPYSSDLGRWAARRFDSTKKQILVRWSIAYFTSLPALFLLSLGIAGLFSCFCQYVFLKAIEKEVPALTAEVAGFTADVVNKLNNASSSWATQANAVIKNQGGDLNKDLFSWVNTSTSALNDTLDVFMTESIKTLNATFGGTPLYDPIKEVFNCIAGMKVEAMQKGLTWVQDHAHINFPQLANDSLSGGALLSKAGPDAQDFFADPKSVTQDDVSKAINKVGAKIEKGIRQEAIISTVILLLWLALFLGSIIIAAIKIRQHEKLRGEAGHDYDVREIVVINNNLDQQLGPAPAYDTTQSDVNETAPYTLNPHPVPRQRPGTTFEDFISTEKHASDNSNAWNLQHNTNKNQPQYNDEKPNGFL